MKNIMTIRTGLVAASVLLASSSAFNSAKAQLVTSPSVFSGDTATISSANYGTVGSFGTFTTTALTDGSASTYEDVGEDQQAQYFPAKIAITGFNSSITTLNLYSEPSQLRLSPEITISYAAAALSGSSLFDPTQYDQTFTISGITYTNFTGETGAFGSPVAYATLTGLDIPVGTQSILFEVTAQPGGGATPPNGYSPEFLEIQGLGSATAAAPEPSTWAMMLGGLATLCFVARRRLNA